MRHKVKVLFSVFLVVAAVSFAWVLTLRGQEYVKEGAGEVNTCKDFKSLSSDEKELWVDGYNTGVARFEEKEGDYQVDDSDLSSVCAKYPKMEISDAIDKANEQE